MKINKWLTIVTLFIVLLSSAIMLWIYFERMDKKLRENEAQIVEKQAIMKIKENFKIRVDAIELLTQQLQLVNNIDSITFTGNASVYYKNYVGFQAINWINRKGIIQWVYPYKGNKGAYGKDLHKHPDMNCRKTFIRSEKESKFEITPIIRLLQGGYGIVIYSPVVKGTKLKGYVNGVFNLNTFFKNILEDFSKLYEIKISNDNAVYYSNLNKNDKNNHIFTKFKLGNSSFVFAINSQIKKGYFNLKNILIISLGILFSLSMILLTWLLFRNVEKERNATNKIYKAYKELQKKQYEINMIIGNNPDGIVRIDKNGKIFQTNKEFLNIIGYNNNNENPDNIYKFTKGKDREKLKKAINELVISGKAKKLFEITFLINNKKTILELNIIPIIMDSKCEYIWIFARDLTEFNILKGKSEQQTKMEAIGKVTSAIAHDFNNILTGIIGYSDMIVNSKDVNQRIYDYALQIKKSGLSAKDLTKDILQFSRKQKLNKTLFDLNEIISVQYKVLREIIKKNVSLKLDLDIEPCMINADQSKIESAISNLVINASDAIEENGFILIKTRHKAKENNRFVSLCVEDNGKGIPNNLINRIFEPFFTTKEMGKGTGLGLSIVYGIVKQHNGDISVKSSSNEGTVFEILLQEETV